MTGPQLFTKFACAGDHRGVDLVSDALPFGRLWYGEPNASATQLATRNFTVVQTIP
jgi:hypothetical protein